MKCRHCSGEFHGHRPNGWGIREPMCYQCYRMVTMFGRRTGLLRNKTPKFVLYRDRPCGGIGRRAGRR